MGALSPLAMSRRYRHNDFTEPMMQKVCPGCWRFVCATRALLGFVGLSKIGGAFGVEPEGVAVLTGVGAVCALMDDRGARHGQQQYKESPRSAAGA